MLRRGTRALLVVVASTALVMAPLVLLGVYFGFYVGEVSGYSKSVLAIAFSTMGFVAGMVIIFRVIRSAVKWVDSPRS